MNLFRGPNGVRAGWRALLFLVLLVAITAGSLLLSRGLLRHIVAGARGTGLGAPPLLMALLESIQLGSVVLATFIMSRIEHRSITSYGLADREGGRHLALGLLWGFVALSVLIGLLAMTGHLAFDGLLLHGTPALTYAVKWGCVGLEVALFEELTFRGYLQSTLTRGMGFWPTAVLLSAGFGAAHMGNSGERTIGLASAGAIGLVFCLALWRTGSLWWPIGFHAAWDWAESYFYGTPDSGMLTRGRLFATHPTGSPLWSGGSVGPEGSVLVLVTIAGVACALVALTHRPTSS
jgi:hypothetical protein